MSIFFGGETRTEEFRNNINEMGEVPVMVDGDFRLSQSAAIQAHVTEKSGKFGGANREEKLRNFPLGHVGQPQAFQPGWHDPLPDELPARG